MDAFQKWVFENVPEYNFERAVMTVFASAFIWLIVFLVLHYVLLKPLMSAFGSKHYQHLTEREKMYYASYYHGIVHANVSACLSLYCFIYADGQPHTTWFICNFYKLHMFDIQKYFHTFSLGYLFYDLVFCFSV